MIDNFKFEKIANKTKLGDLIDVNALYMIRHRDIYVKTVSTNHTTIMTGEQFKHFCETELANSNRVAVKAAKIDFGKETDKFFEYTCITEDGTVKDTYQYYIRLANGEIKEEDCQWRASNYDKWTNIFVLKDDVDYYDRNVVENEILPYYSILPNHMKEDVQEWLISGLNYWIDNQKYWVEKGRDGNFEQKHIDYFKSLLDKLGIEY